MTACRRFELAWQQRFDDQSFHSAPPGDHPDWSGHLAVCPSCRSLDQRFRLLERALAARPPQEPVAPSLSLDLEQPSRRLTPASSRLSRLTPVAAAAALLTAVFTNPLPSGRPTPPVPTPPLRPIPETVADASSASWELARLASENASRLGLDLLTALRPVAPPSPTPPPLEPAHLVEAVSRGLDQSVRPLARTAIRAFDFLVPSPARITSGA
ncbi:MAG: hypothetical protein KatS3mg108_3294 [Isosphaeraceae bacterium]|jgi:hypothetical protein|nr:MAG: hypothetical protein KatS3mg108_3294 [Isosphaeraceae bacterium]